MLKPDPKERYTLEQFFSHPFIKVDEFEKKVTHYNRRSLFRRAYEPPPAVEFSLTWSLNGSFKHGDGAAYSQEFEGPSDRQGHRWRIRLRSVHVKELDRQVVYVYLCNAKDRINSAIVQFEIGLQHTDDVDCHCEDKISHPVDFATVPSGHGIGFKWFYKRDKFFDKFNPNSVLTVLFKMKYINQKINASEHSVDLTYDFDTN